MPHFDVYNPAAFGWTPDRSQIVPYSYDGVAFPSGVHRLAKPAFDGLIAKLLQEGMIPGGLADPGCWGYEYRPVTGNTAGLSFHAYGLALDINAPQNGYVADGSVGQHSIRDAAGPLARSMGFEWGGSWTSPKDYMHFECHLSPAEIGSAATVPGVSTAQPVIRINSVGPAVGLLQKRLNLTVATRPQFGPQTAAAVKQYQRVHGLTADGIVGAQTWTALMHSTVRPGERVVFTGCTGEDVAWLQRKLGLTPAQHPAFGPITKNAVLAWERRWKHVPDGIIEPADWRTLGVAHVVG